MHFWNAARALLLAGPLTSLNASLAEAQPEVPQTQLCWSMGRFDQTVYFAETSRLDDRSANFSELLNISAIDHNSVNCRFLSGEQRTALLVAWSYDRLEAIDTTFLSDLDY